MTASTADKPAVFALKGWSIKQHPKGWLIAPSTPSCEVTPLWQGPFPSLKHATFAIANELMREARRRIARRKGGP